MVSYIWPPLVTECVSTDMGQMQEMIVYQFYRAQLMLMLPTPPVGLVMASGTNVQPCVCRPVMSADQVLLNFSSNITYIELSSFLILYSVGSLGGANSKSALVERITVSNCSFVGTLTGVRIKSWQVRT